MAEFDFGANVPVNENPGEQIPRGQLQYPLDQQSIEAIKEALEETSTFKTIQLEPGEDIQDTIDKLSVEGGGTVELAAGTYSLRNNLNLKNSVYLTGAARDTTILDFNLLAFGVKGAGTSTYAVGTITSIAGGVSVTGSGTSWLANVTALEAHLFINERWHLIAAVTSDTTLVLAEAYSGPTVGAGTAYRIAKPVKDTHLKDLTIKNSTGTGVDFDDGRDILIDNVLILDANVGLRFENSATFALNQVVSVSHTSDGAQFVNCGFADIEGLATEGNGGNGVTLDNCNTFPMGTSASNSNTADGYNITGSNDVVLEVQANRNGGQGIELVATNDNVMIDHALIDGNTSDGIKLTATSDNCKIEESNIKNNGAYGINIAAASCDNTIIHGNTFSGNVTAAINNSGTTTLIRDNSPDSVNDTSGASNDLIQIDHSGVGITGTSLGVNNGYTHQEHPNAADTGSYWSVIVPEGATGISNIRFYHNRQGAGNIYMGASVESRIHNIGTNATVKDTNGAAAALSQTHDGASDLAYITIPSDVYDGLTINEGDILMILFYRDATNAADTYENSLFLTHMRVAFS